MKPNRGGGGTFATCYRGYENYSIIALFPWNRQSEFLSKTDQKFGHFPQNRDGFRFHALQRMFPAEFHERGEETRPGVAGQAFGVPLHAPDG